MSKKAAKAEKPESEAPETDKPEGEKVPKEKTPEQLRAEIFCNSVLFVRGFFHALFTVAVYLAWAEVVSHLLPPHTPLEFLSLLIVTVATFVGWVSGIDIITGLLEPWNLGQHPYVKSRIMGKSEKREHKKA